MEFIGKSAKSPNFFQGNRSSTNKPSPNYTKTRTKSRNFLLNISHVGLNKEDFYNENFIFDFYLLVTKNLNPFSYDWQSNDQNKHQMIHMLWKECIPQKSYKHICKDSNFLYLNGKNVLQPKVSEIITDFLNEAKENYPELRNNLSQYKDIFQYAYSDLFPEIYCSAECRGFKLSSTFHIIFKIYKDKKNIESLGKNPPNYKNVHNETDVYEQKPIKIDDFNKGEENKTKEHVENQKIEQRDRWKKQAFFF